MIHILTIDFDKYSLETGKEIFDQISKILPKEDTLILIPKNVNLYLDVPIEMLYYYRQMFDDIIEERRRSNIHKNDL